jgi:hypothetical protein
MPSRAPFSRQRRDAIEMKLVNWPWGSVCRQIQIHVGQLDPAKGCEPCGCGDLKDACRREPVSIFSLTVLPAISLFLRAMIREAGFALP